MEISNGHEIWSAPFEPVSTTAPFLPSDAALFLYFPLICGTKENQGPGGLRVDINPRHWNHGTAAGRCPQAGGSIPASNMKVCITFFFDIIISVSKILFDSDPHYSTRDWSICCGSSLLPQINHATVGG